MKRNREGHAPSLLGLLMGLVFVVAACMFGASNTFAQTGKIAVKILDAKTGDPLIRATARIVETHQGALSKDNGVATIINVSPSENYTVEVKYPEYETITFKNVHVQSDVTTELSAKMGQKEKEIIVTSDRQMVEKTKTDISTKFNNSTLQSLGGRQRLDQVILLTPGVVQDNSNGGLSIHGSRGTSNSYRFNNVEVSDPLDGRAGTLQNAASRLAISEVDVITAGGDASKGGYTGGEINSQTRAGGSQFELTAHYRTEIPSLFGYSSNGYQQQAAGDNIYEFAAGGPLISNDLKFFVTAKANTFKYYNTFSDPNFSNQGLGVSDPLGNNIGQLPNTERIRRFISGKLTFDVFGFATSADVLLSSESMHLNSYGLNYMDPYYLPGENDLNNVYSLTARGQIGDAGVLELDGSYETLNKQYGKYDHSQPMDIFHMLKFEPTTDNFTYNDLDHTITPGADGIIDIYTPVSRQIPDPANPTQAYGSSVPGINPFTGHIEGPPISYSSNNAYGLVNGFIVSGNPAGFSQLSDKQVQFDAKYTQQIGSHLINGGVSGTFYSIFNYGNSLPWDANPFSDSYYVHPYTAAVYVEDKMEFSDITFQPGLRFDMYQPNAFSINNVYNPVGDSVTATSLQTQVSPRLGITYAVTDQTTFNFNYNWYFKQPTLTDVLANTAGGNLADLQKVLTRGNQIIGNGGLAAERSKEIAVGFQTQLSDIFAFSIQGIYKDLRNQAGLQRVTSPLLPVGFTIYSDDQYGNARSVEITAEKRMADNYSVKFNYTYSVAKGTSSSATENYQQLINADPNSEQAVLPLTPFYLSYDKPSVAQLLFNVNYNKGEGPTIFGTKLLQLFSLATVSEYQSGTPYTKVDLKGQQVGEVNGDREPSYFQTDATLQRTIPFEDLFGESMKNVYLDLQLEVLNVFNNVSALYVYPVTGQGDYDGSNGQYLTTQEYFNDPTNLHGGQIDQFGNLLYNPRIDLNKDGRVSVDEQQQAFTRYRADNFARRTNYQIPRRVYMNFTLRF